MATPCTSTSPKAGPQARARANHSGVAFTTRARSGPDPQQPGQGAAEQRGLVARGWPGCFENRARADDRPFGLVQAVIPPVVAGNENQIRQLLGKRTDVLRV